MIDLCTLGTGGALPLPDRGLASLYVRLQGRGLLVDCGEGTQTAIRLIGWGFRCIDGLLISHFHADHCGGVPGFLLSMAKAKRDEPFHIYGPEGLREVIAGLRVIAPQLPYEVVLHEIPAAGGHFSAIGLDIDAFPLHHSVPCLGFRFELKRPPGFDPQKALALGIPVHQWGTLQGGGEVLHEGRTYTFADVAGAPRKGLSFVYATDTRPVESIVRMGAGTDLMILEGMYGSDAKRSQAHKNRHMIFHEAAELSRRAGTRQLILTHYSNCIEDPAEYLPEAQAIFPETVAAADLMTMTLRYEGR